MWTCDIIEALEAIEKKVGSSICDIDSIRVSPWNDCVYVIFENDSYYTWNTHKKTLGFFSGK